jgi:hypothetical protein
MASRTGKQAGDFVHPIRDSIYRTAGDRLPNFCKQRADLLHVVLGQTMELLAADSSVRAVQRSAIRITEANR